MPFTPGVSCDKCGADLSGAPVASTLTAVDGTFTLQNVPSGTNIPLVIQRGRWRRQFVIPSVPSCTTTALPTSGAGQIRMPQDKTEGDIPFTAFVTGAVDSLECLLRKVGIADSEFTNPGGAGRIQLFLGTTAGAQINASTPPETQLWASQTAINQYDMVYFACEGEANTRTAAQQQVVMNYVNAGGRLFVAHYGYVWLYNDVPFSTTATWVVDQAPSFTSDPETGTINQSFPRGAMLAQWLQIAGGSVTLGQVTVGTLRHDFNAVPAPSLSWLTGNTTSMGAVPLHYSFDAPVGAPMGNQCGRVVFSDFHAEPATSATGMTFPTECTTGAMTPQEMMVEYMLFDLDDCFP